MLTPQRLSELLDALHVAPCYHELLARLVAAAGSRGADLAQTFFCELLEARERDLPEPEALALAACRRWLRRQRLDDGMLAPLVLSGAEGKERERRLEPLPAPIPASRAQIRWGRRDDAVSRPPAPAHDADLVQAVRALPAPERRAVNALYGITAPRRRGRRSRELLALAERAVERLRQVLPQEHFVVEMF